jgi:muconolactone delta-isomerase
VLIVGLNGPFGSHGTVPVELLQLRRQHQDEVHDQLERTAARFAYGVRECPKANSGSVQPLEGAGQFQDRIVRLRVGDWGGYILMDSDDPLEIHKFCSMLPAFEFQARPVVPVADAIRVELEAMAWRDSLKDK